MNEKGTAGRQRPVRTPPTAPTLVAPHFFKKSAPSTRKTASTTINNLSIGGGTKTLVTKITDPKSAVIISRSVFRKLCHQLQRIYLKFKSMMQKFSFVYWNFN